MKWDITHRTQYQYTSPVHASVNDARLQPISNEQQTLESFDLRISPEPRLQHYRDFYFNDVHHFEIPDTHDSLLIESHSLVTTRAQAAPTADARPASRALLKDALKAGRCYDFVQASRFVDLAPETWRLAVDATENEDDVWQCALRVIRFVHTHITYQSHSTRAHTHMSEVLADRRGVCQDLAHVTLGLCRTLKMPALYVSGYLATETASATHAWTEVFVPGIGWLGLDPTHNRLVDETYVKLAVGRDYGDVPPVKGHYKGSTEHRMTVEVKVKEIK